MHFPSFAASAASGSPVIFVNLSNCKSSVLFCSAFRYLDRVLLLDILAAEIGIFFVNSERLRIALAERTIGGLKTDISSVKAAELGTFLNISYCLDRGDLSYQEN